MFPGLCITPRDEAGSRRLSRKNRDAPEWRQPDLALAFHSVQARRARQFEVRWAEFEGRRLKSEGQKTQNPNPRTQNLRPSRFSRKSRESRMNNEIRFTGV